MKQKLTEKEEMLMNIFWQHGPLFIRDLIQYIPEPRPHYNTIAALVKFLEEKGFVEREPVANTFRYTVKTTERQYRANSVGEMVACYYNNSDASLVSQFVEDERMDLHERMHVKCRHSVDLLLFAVFQLLFWWNPLVWITRIELKLLHEYEADEGVLQKGIDATQCQLLLVRKSVGKNASPWPADSSTPNSKTVLP